jgi:hypothetical protein
MAATAAVQPALVEVGDPFEGIPMVGVRGSRSLVGEVADALDQLALVAGFQTEVAVGRGAEAWRRRDTVLGGLRLEQSWLRLHRMGRRLRQEEAYGGTASPGVKGLNQCSKPSFPASASRSSRLSE